MRAKKVDAEKKKKDFEKNRKTSEKVLTRKRVCDILFELSRKRDSDWTLKIKQRDKKRNPRFRWFKDHQKSF